MLLYATKNKEMKINRVQIENATETVVQIGYRDYVVKHKYQLPSKLTEKATFDDSDYCRIETIAFASTGIVIHWF